MLTFLCTLAFAWQAGGDPVQKSDLPQFLKTNGAAESKDFAAKRIKRLENELAAVKAGKINRQLKTARDRGYGIESASGEDRIIHRYEFPSQANKTQKAKELQAQIAEARDLGQQPLLPTLTAATMAVGQVGVIRASRSQPNDPSNQSTVLISKIIDESRAIVHTGDPGASFVLVVNTKGLVDLRPIDVGRSECYEVVGTTTAQGRTLFEVKPFDWREYVRTHKAP